MLILFFSFKSMVSLISFDAELPKTRGREVLSHSKCCISSQNISLNQLEYFMNKIVKIITVKYKVHFLKSVNILISIKIVDHINILT